MFSGNILNFKLWADTIEFVGALLIVFYLIVAAIILIRTKEITHVRLIAADGAITGLSFKTAGTLLKTIELQTWQQLLMFVAIFALRTVLKQFFTWERKHLQKLKDTSVKDMSI